VVLRGEHVDGRLSRELVVAIVTTTRSR